MTSRASPEPHPSATVIPLRDGPGGLEVLLLRRSSRLSFQGGAWVFPGGRIDPADRRQAPADDPAAAARYAAVREAREEAGLTAHRAYTELDRREPEVFTPRLHRVGGGTCTLYQADAGYESGDLDAVAPRHRLWMLDTGWRYERSIGER